MKIIKFTALLFFVCTIAHTQQSTKRGNFSHTDTNTICIGEGCPELCRLLLNQMVPELQICDSSGYGLSFDSTNNQISFVEPSLRVLHLGVTNGRMVVEALSTDPPNIVAVHDGRLCRPNEDLNSGCDTNQCSSTCKCQEGLGNCDSDSECLSGLFCRPNIGTNHGCSSSTDICLNSSYWCSTTCSADNKCQAGRGDCGADDGNCRTGLECNVDNGAAWGCGSTVDICESPAATVCDVTCDGCLTAGQGNCTTAGDNDCGVGLTCSQDVGSYYGCGSAIDICE